METGWRVPFVVCDERVFLCSTVVVDDALRFVVCTKYLVPVLPVVPQLCVLETVMCEKRKCGQDINNIRI